MAETKEPKKLTNQQIWILREMNPLTLKAVMRLEYLETKLAESEKK